MIVDELARRQSLGQLRMSRLPQIRTDVRGESQPSPVVLRPRPQDSAAADRPQSSDGLRTADASVTPLPPTTQMIRPESSPVDELGALAAEPTTSDTALPRTEAAPSVAEPRQSPPRRNWLENIFAR